MRITVVGSINLDLTASAPVLPAPGETVTGATLARHPGGKGANQAHALKRLAEQAHEVRLIGCVGDDDFGREALSLLGAAGVDLTLTRVDAEASTGVALIAVDPSGENQIVVAAGANHRILPLHLPQRIDDPLVLQLELPMATVEAAAARAAGFLCINLAPAAPVSDALLRRADLIVVNETEAAFYGDRLHRFGGQVVITQGARGAVMYVDGQETARAVPPPVTPVDATGAGDVFIAALVLMLLEGAEPATALRFGCTAGALSVTRPGAQPSAPWRAEVESRLAQTPFQADLNPSSAR